MEKGRVLPLLCTTCNLTHLHPKGRQGPSLSLQVLVKYAGLSKSLLDTKIISLVFFHAAAYMSIAKVLCERLTSLLSYTD